MVGTLYTCYVARTSRARAAVPVHLAVCSSTARHLAAHLAFHASSSLQTHAVLSDISAPALTIDLAPWSPTSCRLGDIVGIAHMRCTRCFSVHLMDDRERQRPVLADVPCAVGRDRMGQTAKKTSGRLPRSGSVHAMQSVRHAELVDSVVSTQHHRGDPSGGCRAVVRCCR